jgi:hypothetical protein
MTLQDVSLEGVRALYELGRPDAETIRKGAAAFRMFGVIAEEAGRSLADGARRLRQLAGGKLGGRAEL